MPNKTIAFSKYLAFPYVLIILSRKGLENWTRKDAHITRKFPWDRRKKDGQMTRQWGWTGN
jgi:hypothetical protein